MNDSKKFIIRRNAQTAFTKRETTSFKLTDERRTQRAMFKDNINR